MYSDVGVLKAQLPEDITQVHDSIGFTNLAFFKREYLERIS